MKKGGLAGGGKRGNDIEMNVPKPNFILQMKMNYVASENKNSHQFIEKDDHQRIIDLKKKSVTGNSAMDQYDIENAQIESNDNDLKSMINSDKFKETPNNLKNIVDDKQTDVQSDYKPIFISKKKKEQDNNQKSIQPEDKSIDLVKRKKIDQHVSKFIKKENEQISKKLKTGLLSFDDN